MSGIFFELLAVKGLGAEDLLPMSVGDMGHGGRVLGVLVSVRVL